jgi:hypothetical protein
MPVYLPVCESSQDFVAPAAAGYPVVVDAGATNLMHNFCNSHSEMGDAWHPAVIIAHSLLQ